MLFILIIVIQAERMNHIKYSQTYWTEEESYCGDPQLRMNTTRIEA